MTFTQIPTNPLFDLPPWVGQQSVTFRFVLTDASTGDVLGEINPIQTGTLSHDTSRIIKRQLSLSLGAHDTASINPVSDRINLYLDASDGSTWPLGRYVFTSNSRQVFTSGKLSGVTLNDEMFVVDQQIQVGIDSTSHYSGGQFNQPSSCEQVITRTLAGLNVQYDVAATNLFTNQSWAIGTGRGQVLEALSVAGNYFSPWFGNDGILHFIEAFEPADQIPDFDFDEGNSVIRGGITETDDLLTAPNRFIVVLNVTSVPTQSSVGVYDIPDTAPHSIFNRGFVISKTYDLQAPGRANAQIMARNLGIRNTVFETTTLSTSLDPRHDSYNVIRWQGSLWLELAWSMSLGPGGSMTHTLRKAYGQ